MKVKWLVTVLFAALLLVGLVGWLSRWWVGSSSRPSIGTWVTRYAFSMVPLGFSVWLAHYSFHFLTGFWTFVPVVQSLFADVLGWPLLGEPHWELGALLPMGWLYPLELGFLGLGWFGSLLVLYRLADRNESGSPWRAFLPWAGLITLLFLAAIWLMGQPMEMRGTFLAG